jgi:hypothetical protein
MLGMVRDRVCYINIHHNYVALNSSTGDELFCATLAGAGGTRVFGKSISTLIWRNELVSVHVDPGIGRC